MNTKKYDVFEIDSEFMGLAGEFQVCLGPEKICIIPKWEDRSVEGLRAIAEKIADALNANLEQLKKVAEMAQILRDTTRYKNDMTIQKLAEEAWKLESLQPRPKVFVSGNTEDGEEWEEADIGSKQIPQNTEVPDHLKFKGFSNFREGGTKY